MSRLFGKRTGGLQSLKNKALELKCPSLLRLEQCFEDYVEIYNINNDQVDVIINITTVNVSHPYSITMAILFAKNSTTII